MTLKARADGSVNQLGLKLDRLAPARSSLELQAKVNKIRKTMRRVHWCHLAEGVLIERAAVNRVLSSLCTGCRLLIARVRLTTVPALAYSPMRQLKLILKSKTCSQPLGFALEATPTGTHSTWKGPWSAPLCPLAPPEESQSLETLWSSDWDFIHKSIINIGFSALPPPPPLLSFGVALMLFVLVFGVIAPPPYLISYFRGELIFLTIPN